MFKLRFWWMILRALLLPRDRSGTVRRPFTVTPFDCDLNLHLNNGNFLRFMDLARWDLLLRLGVLGTVWRAGLRPMAVRVEIDFKRGLPPFSRFVVETKMESRRERAMVIRQKFFQGETLAADAKVTVVFVRAGKAAPVEEFLKLLPAGVQLG